MNKEYPKVRRNYSFWRHPIKWYRERKIFKLMNLMFQHHWDNGLEEEVARATTDMMLYGTAFMKDGKRVDPLVAVKNTSNE